MAIFALGHHGQRATDSGAQPHPLASSRTAWIAVLLTPVGLVVGGVDRIAERTLCVRRRQASCRTCACQESSGRC